MNKVVLLAMMRDDDMYWASKIMRWVSLAVCPEPRQRLVLLAEALLHCGSQDEWPAQACRYLVHQSRLLLQNQEPSGMQ